jgi:hypothetical protein
MVPTAASVKTMPKAKIVLLQLPGKREMISIVIGSLLQGESDGLVYVKARRE